MCFTWKTTKLNEVHHKKTTQLPNSLLVQSELVTAMSSTYHTVRRPVISYSSIYFWPKASHCTLSVFSKSLKPLRDLAGHRVILGFRRGLLFNYSALKLKDNTTNNILVLWPFPAPKVLILNLWSNVGFRLYTLMVRSVLSTGWLFFQLAAQLDQSGPSSVTLI